MVKIIKIVKKSKGYYFVQENGKTIAVCGSKKEAENFVAQYKVQS